MNILLLGATGRTGKWALEAALDRGHSVTCLLRKPERIPPRSGLTLMEGDPANRSQLEQALAGCQAVINVLNISRTSDFPWAPLRTPRTYLSDVMTNLVPLGKQHGIQQIVTCSAWGVAETRKDIPSWFRWMIDNSNIGAAYRDHAQQEALLSASNLPWTIVRPVGLTNSKKVQQVRISHNNQPRPTLTIGRRTVGHFLVDCLGKNNMMGQRVVVSKEG